MMLDHLVKFANPLIEMLMSSAKHKPEETDNMKGKADKIMEEQWRASGMTEYCGNSLEPTVLMPRSGKSGLRV